VADSLVAYCNAHTNTPPPRLREVRPDVTDALDALVQQMLSKDPAKRGSPARLLKDFGNLLPPPPAAPRPRPAPDRPRALPPAEPPPPDDRFAPFPPESRGHVSGARTFVRALLVSRGLLTRILFLVLVVLVAAVTWLLLNRP
jgi:serine/threonine-protein kinase